MGARPARLVRLAPEDVGSRVVVRHRLPDGRATDVLGELVALDAQRVAVRRPDGAVVAVAAADVVAARPVPPAPARRAPSRPTTSSPLRDHALPAAVVELEAALAATWPALVVRPLGGWVLRAAGGYTHRANSALPLGDPGVPLPEAVDAVEAFSARHDVPPAVAVLDPSGAGGPLDALLAQRGYRVVLPALVLTAPAAGAAGTTEAAGEPALPAGLSLDLAEDPDEGWLALHVRAGSPAVPSALAVLSGAPLRAFASVRSGARTVAVGRAAVSGRWAGLTAVQVAPDRRRLGLARALLAAMVRWAGAAGASDLALQVEEENLAARALYGGAGFTEHHRYHYRVRA